MRKTMKKITAVASAMAMVMATTVPAFAAEKATYTGTIASDDLSINMDLPADGSLTIKPFAGTQITTAPLYFKNKNTAATSVGDDDIAYTVGLAGYTCVVKSANEDYPITVAKTLPSDSTAKVFTAKIELGQPVASTDEKTDAKDFKTAFTADKSLDIETLSEESYNGTADSVYTPNTAASTTTVQVDPAKSAPFRITGTMNTGATWDAGDTITIVPVFSIGVKVTPKTS